MSKYNTVRQHYELPKNVGDDFIDSAVCSTPVQKSKTDKNIIRKVRSFTDCLFPEHSPDSLKVMSYSNQLSPGSQPATGTKESPEIK